MTAATEMILDKVPFEPEYIGTGELFEAVYPDGPHYPDNRFRSEFRKFQNQLKKMENEGSIFIRHAKKGGVNLITRMMIE